MKAVFAYLLARLAEPTTKAALGGAGAAVTAAFLGQIGWEAGLVTAGFGLAISLVPEAQRSLVAGIAEAVVKAKAPPKLDVLVPFAGMATVLALAACAALPVAGGAAAGAGATIGLQALQAVDAATPEIFQLGCAGVSIADGAFRAAAPGLVAQGKVTAAQVEQEAAIFATSEAVCASPPANAAAAAGELLGQAAAIYGLMATKP